MKIERLEYDDNALIQQWRTGDLPKLWRDQYPELFSTRDYETIANQFRHGWHLGEWFVALHYWHQGHRVLIEKYAFCDSHPEAYRTAETLLGKPGLEFICAHRDVCQPPDLLVYSPDMKKFFFVEVKRPHDRIRREQEKFFQALEERLNCDVIIVKLQQINSPKSPSEREEVLRTGVVVAVGPVPRTRH
jgi:VRR-NUC domain